MYRSINAAKLVYFGVQPMKPCPYLHSNIMQYTNRGFVQSRQTLALWTLASRLPGERPLLEMNGDILWTQQCSSRVRYERNKYKNWSHDAHGWFCLLSACSPRVCT